MSIARFARLPAALGTRRRSRPTAPAGTGEPTPAGTDEPTPAGTDGPTPAGTNQPAPARPAGTGGPAGASAGAPAAPRPPGRHRIPVLRLACTLTEDRLAGLPAAVLALAGESGRQVGTVVLDLGAVAALDGEARAALCALGQLLRQRGTALRLVITAHAVRTALGTAVTHRIGADMVHASLHAAVLAAYAELPGPGLVTGGVRAALTLPADTL